MLFLRVIHWLLVVSRERGRPRMRECVSIDLAFVLATRSIQEILDPLCLVSVDINPEMRVKAAQGPADALLVEQGWRTFLIKVRNEAGATAELRVVSPHAQSLHNAPGRETASDMFFRQGAKRGGKLPREQLWLDLETFDKQPLK